MKIPASILYAFVGGLLALLVHELHLMFMEGEQHSFLHVSGILSWIVLGYFIGRMQERLQQRAAELEESNRQLTQEAQERQQAEKALAVSEEQYRDFFDTSGDLLQSISPDGKVIYANTTWRETLGFTADEVAGLSMFDIIHPDYHEHCMGKFQDLLSGQPCGKFETVFVARDGSEILVEGNCNCRMVDGDPYSIRGIFRDLSERKRMEAELQKAQKLEAIGLLAGGIAHDFNNILTGLHGVISLVKSNLPADNEQVEILNEALQVCLQGKELTAKFVTFSEGGVPIIKCTSVGLLLENAVAIALRGSNVKCDFLITDGLWNVYLDKDQIQLVINNLVMNAREAMPDGGKIVLKVENQTIAEHQVAELAPGKYLQISITDHGVGIPEENLSKIFDPYFTTKSMAYGRGTGFGLSICYSIVRKHDGTITVASEDGKGTSFHIYLPACDTEVVEHVREDRRKGYRRLS